MMTEWYSSPSRTTSQFTGSNKIGLCGVGTQSCFDLVLLNDDNTEQSADTLRLFLELPKDHPDYHEDLQKLSREMNKVFREKAKQLLTRFVKTQPKARGRVHMAAIGSMQGLHLAYATRVETDELINRGADVAITKVKQLYQDLVSPAPKSRARKASVAEEE